MATSINIISQEQIIVAFNITVLIRSTPKIKESHQVLILTMDVTEHLHWGVDLKDHWLCLQDLLGFISESKDVFSSEREESLAINRSRPLLGSQKMVKE
jgi:hypothetical protein